MQVSLYSVVLCFNIIASGIAQGIPSSPYAPEHVQCPVNLQIRPASKGLSSEEITWRENRLSHVVQSLHTYLPRANITGFDLNHYLKAINASNAPVVGLAVSGGGTQSGLGGLGIWQAFDERYAPAAKAGVGGLTQCLSYLSGLSGGGFSTVAPLAASNFSSIDTLRNRVNFTTDYLVGANGNASEYYEFLFENTAAKAYQGFPVSATDILGQQWRQYLPKSWGYKNYSDIALESNHSFSLGLGPMPILALSEVVPKSSPKIDNIMYPGSNSFNLSSFEITPFEFGSWIGGRVQAFMPTRYLGSYMAKGKPASNDSCVRGFDKITWAQGTTGNAFNFWLIDAFFNIPLFAKRDKFSALQAEKRDVNNTIVIPPNQNDNAAMGGSTELLLVDGSETGETIPLRPLIQKERKLDFIIAYDSSLDDYLYNYVNGTNFYDTAVVAAQGGLPFPKVPDPLTQVNLQLNKYPTFFGCHNLANVPLVLRIPNAPWTMYSNYSYTQSSFTDKQFDLVMNNSLAAATYGFGTIDPEWPACLACGVIAKSLARVNTTMPDICHKCFDRHCWNGTLAEKPKNPVYNPRLIMDPKGLDYAMWNSTVWY